MRRTWRSIWRSAPSTAAHAFDFVDALQQTHPDLADLVGLGERSPRSIDEGNGGASFIKRRQKFLSHHRIKHERGDEQHASKCDDKHRCAECEAQESVTNDELHATNDKAITMTAFRGLE